MSKSSLKKYLVEFIGTLLLVFIIVMCVRGNAGPMAPVAIGVGLTALIYLGWPTSGAHYNPAVTIAVWMRKKITPVDIPGYFLAQILGAVVGALIANYLLGTAGADTPEVIARSYIPKVMVAELMGTFLMTFTILAVATSSKGVKEYYAIAIGFSLVAAIYAVGGISGAAFNPAVAIALPFAGMSVWANVWIYVVTTFVAGIISALLYNFIE